MNGLPAVLLVALRGGDDGRAEAEPVIVTRDRRTTTFELDDGQLLRFDAGELARWIADPSAAGELAA
jgi:hypothetical protein